MLGDGWFGPWYPPTIFGHGDVDANAHNDPFKTAMERNSTCQNATKLKTLRHDGSMGMVYLLV